MKIKKIKDKEFIRAWKELSKACDDFDRIIASKIKVYAKMKTEGGAGGMNGR